jgi:predicted nucleotidyltransferase
MNIFLDDHQEMIRLLIESQVEFLLIGGYAVVYHGYKRTTGDMDLWIKPTNENKEKIIKALESAAYENDDLNILNKKDFTKHTMFSVGSEPQKIDFLNHINQVSFEEAYQNKVVFEFDGLQLPVINVRELILSKMNTGRKKDEADIEELQKIINYNKDRQI